MLEDYKYKDLSRELIYLESDKQKYWNMIISVSDMVRMIDKAFNPKDDDRIIVVRILQNQYRKLGKIIEDIDKKISDLKNQCNHEWIDVSEAYDNYTVFKCKKCGSYRKEA